MSVNLRRGASNNPEILRLAQNDIQQDEAKQQDYKQ